MKSQKHITQIPRVRHTVNKAKGAIIAGVPVEVTVVIAELGGGGDVVVVVIAELGGGGDVVVVIV